MKVLQIIPNPKSIASKASDTCHSVPNQWKGYQGYLQWLDARLYMDCVIQNLFSDG